MMAGVQSCPVVFGLRIEAQSQFLAPSPPRNGLSNEERAVKDLIMADHLAESKQPNGRLRELDEPSRTFTFFSTGMLPRKSGRLSLRTYAT